MLIEHDCETRTQYLARVIFAFMQENDIAAECTIEYDGTVCDGYCLADDFVGATDADIELED